MERYKMTQQNIVPPVPNIVGLNSTKVEETIEILSVMGNYPDFVRTDAQKHYFNVMFAKIKANGTVLNSADKFALGMLALNMALVDSAMQSIDDEGYDKEVQGDRNMIVKKNPACERLDKAQAQVNFYLKEFGMTPNSRPKELTPTDNSGASDGFDKV